MTPRRSAPVESLFGPGTIVAHELWGQGDDADLSPAEAAIVAGAVDNRRRQFAAGRRCASAALGELGVDAGPVLVGERRSPRWPAGFNGSISHTEGYAVAVAVPFDSGVDDAATVGVDAERLGRVADRLFGHLFGEAERHWLADLDAEARDLAATSMFGAKEAFYKAQFPRTGSWVGFHDVAIAPGGDVDDRLEWTLSPATDLAALEHVAWPITARSLVSEGIVVTGLRARSRGRSDRDPRTG